jgi:hypothetical protein
MPICQALSATILALLHGNNSPLEVTDETFRAFIIIGRKGQQLTFKEACLIGIGGLGLTKLSEGCHNTVNSGPAGI